MKITTNMPYLKCIKEIEACPGLEVGDLVWSLTDHEIWPGGYEYVKVIRREDGCVFKFRVEHLSDHFEIENVEEERYHG